MYEVGDIIKNPQWDYAYEVTHVYGNNYYNIQNTTTGVTVPDFYILFNPSYIMERAEERNNPLSAIERKIALMERRFQKKQQEKNHVAS